MLPLEMAVLALWVSCTSGATVMTVRWFARHGRANVRAAVIWTTCAAAPGVLQLIEIAFRIGELHRAFAFSTTLLSCAWFVVGPILLAVGVVMRARAALAPRGTTLVQALHVATWIGSSLVGARCAISV